MAQAFGILDAYLETHDGQKALNSMHKLWGQLEPTLNKLSGSTLWKYNATTYKDYLEIAKIFAALGNLSMARELYDRAGQVWEVDKYFWAQRDIGDRIIAAAETNFSCFKSFIDQEEGTEKLDSFERTCRHEKIIPHIVIKLREEHIVLTHKFQSVVIVSMNFFIDFVVNVVSKIGKGHGGK